MAQIQARHLRSQILAMSVATMLALYTIGVTMPALTPVSAYATNYDDKNKEHDDKNKKQHDDKNKKQHDDNKYKSSFLSDVEQCFPNSGNYGELFSDDVENCIYDVMAAYFNNDNNDESGGSTTSGDNDESDSNDNESIPSSQI
jgi:hypothetical protein